MWEERGEVKEREKGKREESRGVGGRLAIIDTDSTTETMPIQMYVSY